MYKALNIFFIITFFITCNENNQRSIENARIPKLDMGEKEVSSIECRCDSGDAIQMDKEIARLGFPEFIHRNGNDLNYKHVLLGKINTSDQITSFLFGFCDKLSPNSTTQYWLYSTNQKNDSIQYIELTPFLGTKQPRVAFLKNGKEFISLYHDEIHQNVIEFIWKWSVNEMTYSCHKDTLTELEVKSKYPKEVYSNWVINLPEKQQGDTLYKSYCDMDLDGTEERILVLDTVADNYKYEYTKCYTLLIEKKVEGHWNTWRVSTKAMPAMNKETTAYSFDYVCKRGYFGFTHIDESSSTLAFEFRYDPIVKEIVLDKVTPRNKDGEVVLCCDHERPALAVFDFTKDGFQ